MHTDSRGRQHLIYH